MEQILTQEQVERARLKSGQLSKKDRDGTEEIEANQGLVYLTI